MFFCKSCSLISPSIRYLGFGIAFSLICTTSGCCLLHFFKVRKSCILVMFFDDDWNKVGVSCQLCLRFFKALLKSELFFESYRFHFLLSHLLRNLFMYIFLK